MSASVPPGGRAVIVGAGVAGTAAAATLCAARPDVSVTLVARDATVRVRLLVSCRGGVGNASRRATHPSTPHPTSQAAVNIVRLSKHVESFDS